jgi:hypothetical protein
MHSLHLRSIDRSLEVVSFRAFIYTDILRGRYMLNLVQELV